MVITTTKKFCVAPFAALAQLLFFEQLFFLFLLRPFIGVRGRGLAFDDRLPDLRELAIERDEFLLRIGHVVLREDRFHRAFGNTQRAVDALVGIGNAPGGVGVGVAPCASGRWDERGASGCWTAWGLLILGICA